MGRTVGTKDRSGCLMGELGLVGNMGSLFLPSFGLNAEKPVCFVFRSGAAAAVTGSVFVLVSGASAAKLAKAAKPRGGCGFSFLTAGKAAKFGLFVGGATGLLIGVGANGICDGSTSGSGDGFSVICFGMKDGNTGSAMIGVSVVLAGKLENASLDES